jgi:hypothetical protein
MMVLVQLFLYYFICGLFNDAVGSSDYIVLSAVTKGYYVVNEGTL